MCNKVHPTAKERICKISFTAPIFQMQFNKRHMRKTISNLKNLCTLSTFCRKTVRIFGRKKIKITLSNPLFGYQIYCRMKLWILLSMFLLFSFSCSSNEEVTVAVTLLYPYAAYPSGFFLFLYHLFSWGF